MIIQRNISGFVVFSGDSVLDALKKITANRSRIVFAVSDNGVLEGVLSDGDFRRWLSSQRDIDLDQPVSVALNPSFEMGSNDEAPAVTEKRFRESIDHIPLVDSSRRIVAIAARTGRGIAIVDKVIDRNNPARLISDIGNNRQQPEANWLGFREHLCLTRSVSTTKQRCRNPHHHRRENPHRHTQEIAFRVRWTSCQTDSCHLSFSLPVRGYRIPPC